MDTRQAAREAMRRKIVEATMDLHTEQGILATSWEDIARKADVALATVYRYFPTIDELVQGCGALVFKTIRPPRPEDAPGLFEGAADIAERLRRLAVEFCALYERAEKPFVAARRDCDKIPRLQQFVDGQRATVDAYVREALRAGAQDRLPARGFVPGVLTRPAGAPERGCCDMKQRGRDRWSGKASMPTPTGRGRPRAQFHIDR